MKNIYLNAAKTKDVFNDLKDSFGGTLIADNDEFNLEFASVLARGSIKGNVFSDKVTYIQFDVIFHDHLRLSMESLGNSPIFFVYCTQGNLRHSFGERGEKKSIKRQQMGVLKSNFSVNSILHFEKNVPIKFYIINIGTSNISDNDPYDVLIKKIRKVFFKTKKNYLDINDQNFKIAEKIEKINALPHTGMVRNIFINRLLENILELEIQQHTDVVSEVGEKINSFILKQVDEINKVTDYILNLSLELFTTDFIAQKFWKLTHKMQKEFKLLFARSVHDFLVYIRIERGI